LRNEGEETPLYEGRLQINFTIKNSLLIQDYLKQIEKSEFLKAQLLDWLALESYEHCFIDLLNIERHEESPCHKILILGTEKLEKLFDHLNNLFLKQ
jgi:hypothetical protein